MKLSLANLDQIQIQKPSFDPRHLKIGVVHFGPGAFFRAHQASYFDDLNAIDPRFGICAVSLHSTGVRDALGPQDGLYCLLSLDRFVEARLIGSIRQVIMAPQSPADVIARLAHSDTHFVTSTITEKGYGLDQTGALDLSHTEIAHDLLHREQPISFMGYVLAGLWQRFQSGLMPFIILSCDNLPKNGTKVKAALQSLCAHIYPEMLDWLKDNLQAPCTMVDSITPATTDALKNRVKADYGLDDAWPIQRESFLQWVIEAHKDEAAPDWAAVGVTITPDVSGFEHAKLRLLNAAHSSLAYQGIARGHKTVTEAMRDVDLANRIEAMMLHEIAPLINAPQGLDLNTYIGDILNRFRNPEIAHNLSQIAWDGSQKIPIRLLSSITEAMNQGRPYARLAGAVAAWMHFIRTQSHNDAVITDPLEPQLRAIGRTLRGDIADVEALLGIESIFPQALAKDTGFRHSVNNAYVAFMAP